MAYDDTKINKERDLLQNVDQFVDYTQDELKKLKGDHLTQVKNQDMFDLSAHSEYLKIHKKANHQTVNLDGLSAVKNTFGSAPFQAVKNDDEYKELVDMY